MYDKANSLQQDLDIDQSQNISLIVKNLREKLKEFNLYHADANIKFMRDL
jgi:hypothetical protein